MKSITSTIIFLLLSSVLFGQARTNDAEFDAMLKDLLSHTVPEVTAEEVNQLDKNAVIFIDAREKNEYEVSHIENAIWVGYSLFQTKRIKELPKAKKVIVYCSVGYRSEKVSEKLLKMGFHEVSNLYGGIFDWVNKGYQVVNGDAKTNKVHAYNKNWGKWLKKGEKVY